MPSLSYSRFLPLFALLLLAAAFFGCSPRQQGAAPQGFYATGAGGFAVGVNPPLALVSTGVLSGDVPSDALPNPSATFSYALFGDTGQGPVSRHVHGIFSELALQGPWRWEIETWARPESLSYAKASGGGHIWTVQILPVTAREDWFSALWQENGRATPEFWLAKRWSARPLDDTRIVLEYREAAPQCMLDRLIAADTARRTDRNASLLRGHTLWPGCEQAVEEFSRRADAAVNLSGLNGLPERPVQILTARPHFLPNMGRLVGRAEIVEPFPPD